MVFWGSLLVLEKFALIIATYLKEFALLITTQMENFFHLFLGIDFETLNVYFDNCTLGLGL